MDAFHLTLGFGDEEVSQSPKPELLKNGQPLKPDIVADLLSSCKYRVVLDWSAGDDEDQVFLKLQSQLMVTLPAPRDEIQVNIGVVAQQMEEDEEDFPNEKKEVHLNLLVHKQREFLKVVSLTRTVGSGPSGDGLGVLTRVLVPESIARASVTEELLGYTQNYQSISVLNLSSCILTVISSTEIFSSQLFCSLCQLPLLSLLLLNPLHFGFNSVTDDLSFFTHIALGNVQAVPSELMKLPMLEKLYLDNNKITLLPPEVGHLTRLQVLQCDHNALISVPGTCSSSSILRALKCYAIMCSSSYVSLFSFGGHTLINWSL